jgi:hypothetical protein
MMRVVLDTNILISGILSAKGAPAEILRLEQAGKFDLAIGRDRIHLDAGFPDQDKNANYCKHYRSFAYSCKICYLMQTIARKRYARSSSR